MTTTKPGNINEYIAGFPDEVQKLLQQVRNTVKKAVPKAEEMISYGMPGFKLNGQYVVYFAGYKKHIGLYPVPNDKAFEKDFAAYKTSGKGAIQFPLDKPMPLELIGRIVKYNVKRNEEKTIKKKSSTKK